MDTLNIQSSLECAANEANEVVQVRTLLDLELALIGGGSGDVIFA